MPYVPNSADATFPLQAGLYDSDLDPLQVATASTGVVSGLAVTSNSNATVNVASGQVALAGVQPAATAANAALAVTADASNPRFALVVVSGTTGVVSISLGTAAASPVPPTLTSTQILVAQVYVEANDTNIASTQIVDKRVTVVPMPLSARDLLLGVSGAIAETYNRSGVTGVAQTLTSGTLTLVAVPLVAGRTITSIAFKSSTQAAVSPTNQWFGLFDASRVALRFTNNDTNTAWAALTVKTLNLTSTYTPTVSALGYIGIMVSAGTAPGIMGLSNNVNITNIPPIVAGTSNTGQTTVPSIPFTASALTAVSTPYYGWYS